MRLTGASSRIATQVLRSRRADRGRRYDLVLATRRTRMDAHAGPLADLLPDVLTDDALVVVETSDRVEPELPLALVTTRRYGSARITVYSR